MSPEKKLFVALFCFPLLTLPLSKASPTPAPTSLARVRVRVTSRVVMRIQGTSSELFPDKEKKIFRKGLQVALPRYIANMNDVRILSYQPTSPTSNPTSIPTSIPTGKYKGVAKVAPVQKRIVEVFLQSHSPSLLSLFYYYSFD